MIDKENIILEAEVTKRILQETEDSIAEIERMLRKPLPTAKLTKILSLYTELALTKDTIKNVHGLSYSHNP